MLFKYKNTAQLNLVKMKTEVEVLRDYAKHLQTVSRDENYVYPESSINLPFDADMVAFVDSAKKLYKSKKLKYFIDVGIGGSNLGTKAIYDGIFGHFDSLTGERFPRMIFADTNDSHFLYSLRSFLSKIKDEEEVLINVISKSGSTTETIANLKIILHRMSRFKDRVVITTAFNSPLWNEAQEIGMFTLPIPDTVGGRYSVFSPVGLFPLMCVGIDVGSLLEGAQDNRSKCLTSTIEKNPAALSALVLYHHYKNGKNINDNFIFHPEFESIGKWYRQLMGESLGKEDIGITPTVSIGSTDLHSMGQLYLGGPKDKVFTFISVTALDYDVKVPVSALFPDILEEIQGKTASEIMDAILTGVKIAYKKEEIPFMEIIFDDLTEYSIGEFLQFKMCEMMYLGQLLDVNAFNQPNVESYKVETKKILNNS